MRAGPKLRAARIRQPVAHCMRTWTRAAVIRTIAAALIAAALVVLVACGDDSSKGTRDDPFPYEKSRSGFGWG